MSQNTVKGMLLGNLQVRFSFETLLLRVKVVGYPQNVPELKIFPEVRDLLCDH